MSFFYKGAALPWGQTIPSVIDVKDDYNVIQTSILFIILCGLGERPMLPTYGSLLPKLVFQPNDLKTLTQIKESIKGAISKWDPRVTFVNFTATAQGSQITCAVSYKQNFDRVHDDIQVLSFNLTNQMLLP